MTGSDFSRPFIGGYGSSPSRRGPAPPQAARPTVRSPRFRRGPFVREGVSDLGRASAPRMTAPHMLPSTLRTASASATCSLSRLNCPPRTIAVYASPRSSPSTTQHSLPGGRYPLPGPDLHRLDRASLLAHQWLAYRRPCRRFAPGLAADDARLGADAVRYSFIVVDWRHLLLAGLPAHCPRNPLGNPLGIPSNPLYSAAVAAPGDLRNALADAVALGDLLERASPLVRQWPLTCQVFFRSVTFRMRSRGRVGGPPSRFERLKSESPRLCRGILTPLSSPCKRARRRARRSAR